MADENRIIHRTAEQARGGSTPNIMRWVLGISLLAAIIALSAIWIFGAANQAPGSDVSRAVQVGDEGGDPPPSN